MGFYVRCSFNVLFASPRRHFSSKDKILLMFVENGSHLMAPNLWIQLCSYRMQKKDKLECHFLFGAYRPAYFVTDLVFKIGSSILRSKSWSIPLVRSTFIVYQISCQRVSVERRGCVTIPNNVEPWTLSKKRISETESFTDLEVFAREKMMCRSIKVVSYQHSSGSTETTLESTWKQEETNQRI